MIHFPRSIELFEEAKQYIPGGVNSPVRAFKAVGGTPVFAARGKGCYLHDVDGNRYIDFCCSWGPLILGHAPQPVVEAIHDAARHGTSFGMPVEAETRLASLICSHIPFVEKIRFVNSGTEAVMSAIRLARGFTGRDKIIKFEGCYHGHADYLLVKAGSGLATAGIASSAGVPRAFAAETIVLPLDDEAAVESAFGRYGEQIACVIIEPLPANNGMLIQRPEFLRFLRQITQQYGSLLIFDEVISGFRVGFQGIAGYYGIKPDLVTYGKVVGGGLPVGAFGGCAAVMDNLAPEGKVYQAGTLSGNPLAMVAGYAQLKECLKPGFYNRLQQRTENFAQRITSYCIDNRLPARVWHFESIFWIAFTEKYPIRKASDITPESVERFNRFYHNVLHKGVYFGPSAYEVGFVSDAHSEEILQQAADMICQAISETLKH